MISIGNKYDIANKKIKSLLLLFIFFSTQFGFVDWSKQENIALREIIKRAIITLRSIISLEDENVGNRNNLSSNSDLNETLVKKESDELSCVNTRFKKVDCLKDGQLTETLTDFNTYCKLGHLHLLLEEYDNGW